MTSSLLDYIPCPWVWIVGDPGEQLIFTVNWDTATTQLLSIVAFRDIDCVYDTIYLRYEPYDVPIGETLIRYRNFPPEGFNTIYDIIYSPISVGISQTLSSVITPTLQVT